jgi:hypothetical protein
VQVGRCIRDDRELVERTRFEKIGGVLHFDLARRLLDVAIDVQEI